MNWIELKGLKLNAPGYPELDAGKCYRSGNLHVIITRDPPDARWHISISHPHRYPTYEEIKKARYDLVPNDVYMAMIFPPKEEFVNLHKNCFHLHEFRDKEIIAI